MREMGDKFIRDKLLELDTRVSYFRDQINSTHEMIAVHQETLRHLLEMSFEAQRTILELSRERERRETDRDELRQKLREEIAGDRARGAAS